MFMVLESFPECIPPNRSSGPTRIGLMGGVNRSLCVILVGAHFSDRKANASSHNRCLNCEIKCGFSVG